MIKRESGKGSARGTGASTVAEWLGHEPHRTTDPSGWRVTTSCNEREIAGRDADHVGTDFHHATPPLAFVVRSSFIRLAPGHEAVGPGEPAVRRRDKWCHLTSDRDNSPPAPPLQPVNCTASRIARMCGTAATDMLPACRDGMLKDRAVVGMRRLHHERGHGADRSGHRDLDRRAGGIGQARLPRRHRGGGCRDPW